MLHEHILIHQTSFPEAAFHSEMDAKPSLLVSSCPARSSLRHCLASDTAQFVLSLAGEADVAVAVSFCNRLLSLRMLALANSGRQRLYGGLRLELVQYRSTTCSLKHRVSHPVLQSGRHRLANSYVDNSSVHVGELQLDAQGQKVRARIGRQLSAGVGVAPLCF